MRPGETAAGARTDSETDLYPLYMQKSAGKATEGCRRCDEIPKGLESRQRIIGIFVRTEKRNKAAAVVVRKFPEMKEKRPFRKGTLSYSLSRREPEFFPRIHGFDQGQGACAPAGAGKGGTFGPGPALSCPQG